MDAMTFQPAAGAHGEFTGLLLIKAYHHDRGDHKRTKILVPDSAHGTNPASAAMAGFTCGQCAVQRRTAAWTWRSCGKRSATTPPA